MPHNAKVPRSIDAYRTLKAEIRSTALPPGYQAPEPELALRLGVSRTTLREALIRLESEGLIRLIPRRGVLVRPVTAADMREIYDILTALESEAAAALAARGLSPEELRPLSDATADMQDALARGALEDWAEADDRFHAALLDLHGNRRLTGFVRNLSDQAHRARMATLRLRDIPKRSTQEHTEILDALIAGDPERARTAFRTHRARAAQELLGILEKIQHL